MQKKNVFGWLLLFIACTGWAFVQKKAIRIFSIGDSTMCYYDIAGMSKRYGGVDYPIRGWMMLFPEYLQPGVQVFNCGASGRSTKSFRQEGLWKKVTDSLQAGDYVFIQFGHNDEKTDTLRHTDAATSFRNNLVAYVNETRAKGAYPVLFSSIARRAYDSAGHVVDTHGDYVKMVKRVADSLQVPFVDMHAATMALLEKMGPDAAKQLYLYVPAGAFTKFPEGLKDDTHLCEAGARVYAGLAAAVIKQLHLPLAAGLK